VAVARADSYHDARFRLPSWSPARIFAYILPHTL
jgi:hypothetical protein